MSHDLETHERGGEPYVEWRAGCLLRAGFELEAAEALAADKRYDLHALLELLDRGCPPELAARIVAP